MRKIRLVIVDDHTLFRQALRSLIATEPAFEVVGEAGSAEEGLHVAEEQQPDLVLMDVIMPGVSSFSVTRQLKKRWPKMAIVFLSMYDDDEYVRAAKAAGASGYVLKDALPPVLFGLLHRIAKRPAQFVWAGINERSHDQPKDDLLTTREIEVIKLLAEGNSVKEVAVKLGLSVNTAQAHKFRLMRKLHLHNRAQLVHYAVAAKLIAPPSKD